MASISQIFEGAETLGDASSLRSFGAGKARVKSRIIGKGAGMALGGLNVWGLIMWAQFFNFLNNQIRADASKPMVVGTFASYAAGYEYGFTNPPGSYIENQPRPFFWPAVKEVRNKMFKGQGPQIPKRVGARSGLYQGGQFALDMKNLVNGNIGQRAVRRGAGAETSAFFWGSLMNPDKNVMESFVKLIVRQARKNVESQGLKDTGALKNSITWAEDFNELKQKSYKAIRHAAEGDPRIDRRFGEM